MSKDSGRLTPENTVVTIVSKNALRLDKNAQDACLVMIVGDEIGKRFALGDRELVIGRSSAADIQLDIDNISRSHACIQRTAIGWVVKDLGSTNGTFVNDSPIKEHLLRDGDQIRVGRAMLKFLTSSNVEARYHEEIYRLMTLDGLTQVHNKRFFQDALDKELARSKRYSHPFALVLFDIDHFKKVNDTYGHVAGDEVLRRVAQLVKSKVRTNDIFARIGGEEFAVLLPEVGLAGGETFAEKLRKLIEAERILYEGVTLSVTISLGVTEVGADAESADQVVKLADAKLYDAKRSGRNRVCS